jgi:hypothetical protein
MDSSSDGPCKACCEVLTIKSAGVFFGAMQHQSTVLDLKNLMPFVLYLTVEQQAFS